MKKVFNRGFTQGFLFQDYLNLAQDIPGNQGIKIGKMINYSKKEKCWILSYQIPFIKMIVFIS